ncbi:SCO2522 family protein [Nocardia miyunensis]|uniref:SCO2522 family protein n=1 Tax=Nocardia miyunensis TaxID=282684 RepID=UPI000831B3A5|nr:SCO2522 family protein [Nocardia miyunensis]
MDFSTGYSEATEQAKIANVELSHLSIETGHFYMKDLTDGLEPIRTQFRRVQKLVDLYTEATRAEFGNSARVSTCFLIDDYFGPNTDPTEVLAKILGVAQEYGLTIDYLAREASCWESPQYVDGQPTGHSVPLAEMIASWIVAEPVPATTGGRPPDVESGWLCNGRRSSEYDSKQAMQLSEYRPSEELGRREHSIFLDVELWNENIRKDGSKNIRWSCPYLASIWQLLRLGMVRYDGGPVVQPQPRGTGWPERWWEMPSVVQLNPKAAPFAAYQTLSILPQSYLKIEHAVRMILDHVHLDEELVAQTLARGAREGVEIPRELTRRLQHVFINEVSVRPVDGA